MTNLRQSRNPTRAEANTRNGQTDTFAEENKREFFVATGELPLEYLREYDGAAEHFARHNELPQAMGSPGALDYINADPEAFEQRVRDFQYAAAMEATHNKAKLSEEQGEGLSATSRCETKETK